MMPQFVAVQHGASTRAYTYHNEGAPAGVGDRVEVETRHGKTVGIVTEVSDAKPSFPTKPVTKIIETAAARAARKETPAE